MPQIILRITDGQPLCQACQRQAGGLFFGVILAGFRWPESLWLDKIHYATFRHIEETLIASSKSDVERPCTVGFKTTAHKVLGDTGGLDHIPSAFRKAEA